MSIKSEFLPDNDVESGQCSDDEVQFIKKEKRTKKHKKKDKLRKTRKRNRSNSSSCEKSPADFFNPYSVNPGKFVFKTECVEMCDILDNQLDNNEGGIANDEIISDTFNNLTSDDHVVSLGNGPLDLISTSNAIKDNIIVDDCGKGVHLQESIKRRESEYRIDISGIDTVTSDLYHYLLDLGLSSSIVSDILQVFNNEEEEQEVETKEGSDNDEDDGYEEEMINDIPIIEQATHLEQSLFSGGYSPEHANDLVEPYKPQNYSNVGYASNIHHGSKLPPLNQLIDPFSIPDVGPRDPRLNQTKTLLQMKPNIVAKPIEVIKDKVVPIEEVGPTNTMDWETTVLNVVKTHLKLYLSHNDINKEEYKSILKRAVNRIITCGESKLETDKISKFLHSYVTLTQKDRRLNNV